VLAEPQRVALISVSEALARHSLHYKKVSSFFTAMKAVKWSEDFCSTHTIKERPLVSLMC